MNIQGIGDRGILVLGGCYLMMGWRLDKAAVAAALAAFILACMGVYLKDRRFLSMLTAVYFILSCFCAPLVVMYAIPVYEAMLSEKPGRRVCRAVFLATFSVLAVWLHREEFGIFLSLGILGEVFLAFWLWMIFLRMEHRQVMFFDIRDVYQKERRTLKRENRYLLEKQNSEIYAATLRERNRIAGEIHDNVGHMLSRAILMTGAMLTVAKEEAVREGLRGLKECLDEAMTSIRRSIHGLYDESVDLEQAVRGLIKDLSGYQVTLEYDMTETIPRNIKYCLIAVIKEALSNIIRHSDARRIEISLVEHPAFYRLVVADNGSQTTEEKEGIGLYNMRQRVESLGGSFYITADGNGFQILASIPIQKEEENEYRNRG